MPLVQVTASKGQLDSKSRDQLMSRLSTAVIRAEGADVNDPAARSLVWATFAEGDQSAVYVGGEISQNPPVVIELITPEGALTDTTRQSLVEEVREIVDDIIGPYKNSLNHWALLREISEGGWGGAGKLFPLAAIQDAMNINARIPV